MEMTTKRLAYLLYLDTDEKKTVTVTELARFFQVSKASASRNISYLVSQKIVCGDSLRLTEEGKAIAGRYREELRLMEEYLQETVHLDENENRENAMQMVMFLTEGMKEQLFRRTRLNRLFQQLKPLRNLTFSEFADMLGDGDYPVAFVIYRENFERGKYLSMADRGMEHPATLRVRKGTGTIQLKAVALERRNLMERLMLHGKLAELEYEGKKGFEPTVKDGDYYSFPAEMLDYTYHAEENLLIGNCRLRTCAPLKEKKIHIRTAIFSMIIQKI